MPRSFLQPGSNDIVLFEQFGGDPSKISFTTKQTESVCAHVSEDHPDQIDSWISPQQKLQRSGPALRLECPKEGQVISSIKFASFGTPSGTCGSYSHGECSSSQALAVAQEVTPICSTSTLATSFCSSVYLHDTDNAAGNSPGMRRGEQLQCAGVSKELRRSMQRSHKKPCGRSCMLMSHDMFDKCY